MIPDLEEYFGLNVTATTKDGQRFLGTACDYTPSQDNDNGIASICVGDFELYENEIENITITE